MAAAERDHVERHAADERSHQERVRKHTAGVQSAKEALGHINAISHVFDHFMEQGDPEQDWYESAYRAAVLAAVDIDDEATAKTITDIAEAYWASWLATELGEWTPQSLSFELSKLAQATVRAYTQDTPRPDRSGLDRITGEIESRWAERREDNAQARAAERAQRAADREARARDKKAAGSVDVTPASGAASAQRSATPPAKASAEGLAGP
jgi:hypothetical protein